VFVSGSTAVAVGELVRVDADDHLVVLVRAVMEGKTTVGMPTSSARARATTLC